MTNAGNLADKKPTPLNNGFTHTNHLSMVNKTQRKTLVERVMNCVHVAVISCESYATRFLRISFFTLNLVMLYMCMVNLD